MEKQTIEEVLKKYKEGSIDQPEVLLYLKEQPYLDLEYAKLDTHRGLRQGVPEVIYGAGKTKEQILGIVNAVMAKPILITRLEEDAAEHVAKQLKLAYNKVTEVGSQIERKNHAEDECMKGFTYHTLSKTGIIGSLPAKTGNGKIVVATGGTSDIPVAEEAALTAEVLGNEVVRLYDVGVAGLHRLLNHMDEIMSASVIIAIAGMEGALASVIGGLSDCPVIAVPTSVGYGANFGGLSALLSMLNSCASGVSVVNIDNGFGAGYQASMINHPKCR